MSDNGLNLGKKQLLILLDKNPPDLYSALSNALNDSDLQKVARNTAKSKKILIDKIKPMKAIELRELISAAQPFLESEELVRQ